MRAFTVVEMLNDSQFEAANISCGPISWRCTTCMVEGIVEDIIQNFDDVMMEHRRLSPRCSSNFGNIHIKGLAGLGLGEYYDHNPEVWEPYSKVFKYLLNWRRRQEIIDRSTEGEFSSKVKAGIPEENTNSCRVIEVTLRGSPGVATPIPDFQYKCLRCGTVFMGLRTQPNTTCPACGCDVIHPHSTVPHNRSGVWDRGFINYEKGACHCEKARLFHAHYHYPDGSFVFVSDAYIAELLNHNGYPIDGGAPCGDHLNPDPTPPAVAIYIHPQTGGFFIAYSEAENIEFSKANPDATLLWLFPDGLTDAGTKWLA